MRKTMSRLTRAAGAAAAVVLMTSGVALTGAPAAFADTCSGRLCGAVKNRTGRTMHITLNLGEGSGYCDVWNWQGGPGDGFRHAKCDQQAFGNGTKGGNGTGVDVDAFTFNGEGYHERFSRVGSWHWRDRGVWTKIRSGEIADCGIGDKNQIWCTVLWQVG
ncbi:hypothetical protein [Sphaerisporangium fuscum]|uniref:hypothetical protein n=1 Tax=Sphaerisporangium fuscum TaxID=2835868 RepID=UPI001BDCB2F9|nr:hypothetical protein [Sphaerisporangium fuscum]